MQKNLIKWVFCLAILLITLIAVSLFSLVLGSAEISWRRVCSFIFSSGSGMERTILLHIRLPRIVLAIAVGGGLSLAGVIFQGMFRNPLVEPYTLGVSGGAALAVALAISLGGCLFLPLVGFLGALAAVSCVYLIAAWRGSWRVTMLLLTGVMISFITSSLIMFVMSVSRVEQLHGIIFWIMGNLGETQWPAILIVLIVVVFGLLASIIFSRELNALALGDEEATHLGINVELTKRILFVLASLVTGCVVSVSGIIGFVGLVVPHFLRLFIGNDHRLLIPAAFLGGGIFLVLSDTVARTVITPLQLPVGVITGIVGGIMFIIFLSRKRFVLGGSL